MTLHEQTEIKSNKQHLQQQSKDKVLGCLYEVHGVVYRHKGRFIAAHTFFHNAKTYQPGNQKQCCNTRPKISRNTVSLSLAG